MASLAIDAPTKWTDNALSQHPIDGVLASQRGVARRISRSALLQLALARELHLSLGLAVRDALALAGELLARDGDSAETRRGYIRIDFDRAALVNALDRRLRESLESAPAPRRGRPPNRRGAK